MLKVIIRYFGKLREILETECEEYNVKDNTKLGDLLLHFIPQKHKLAADIWQEKIFMMSDGFPLLNSDGAPILRNFLVLIDGKSLPMNHKLENGEEIIIMPPFGGGVYY